MQFLMPAAFALAALLPAIVAMYLLKLRRTEQVVSSTYLWRRMVRDVEANAPWQRLRHNLLLYLQLLFLVLLIVALARPFTWAEGAGGQATIVVLDTSASMSANDTNPTRLEAAKVRARQIVDDLPEDARATIIAAGQQARVLLSSSLDRRQAHLAIDQVRAEVGGSDLAAALELASAVAARQPDTEIVVLSDGRVDLPERLALRGRVRYVPMGVSGENQAISTVSLRPMPGGQYLAAFVQVANYGEADAQRRLALYVDGELANAYDVQVPAKGQWVVVADDISPDAEIVEAELLGADALALDDRAWAVGRTGDRTAVALLSEGNRYLETALGLMANIEVTVVAPEEARGTAEQVEGEGAGQGTESSDAGPAQALEAADLVVLDGEVLEAEGPATTVLGSGSLLYIAPPSSTAFFSVTGRIERPVARAVDVTDPLVAHTAVEQVSILEAAQVSLPAWARAILVADVEGESPVPLLFVGQLGGRRIAVLAFDLRRSDLPLQVSFPLLLANLMEWLVPEQGAGVPGQVRPGAAVSLAVPPGVEEVEVRLPSGGRARLEPMEGRVVFAGTSELGVYEVAWGEQHARFAVSMLSARESDIAPADDLAVQGMDWGRGEEPAMRARQEWWRSAAYVGLAVLMVEWGVYQRAAVARAAGWVRRRVGAGRG